MFIYSTEIVTLIFIFVQSLNAFPCCCLLYWAVCSPISAVLMAVATAVAATAVDMAEATDRDPAMVESTEWDPATAEATERGPATAEATERGPAMAEATERGPAMVEFTDRDPATALAATEREWEAVTPLHTAQATLVAMVEATNVLH